MNAATLFDDDDRRPAPRPAPNVRPTDTPFRYPGGKQRSAAALAARLRPLVADAGVYAEPFIGGGSVLLRVASDHPSARLHVNDANPEVAAYWSLCADGTDDEAAAFTRLLGDTPTVESFVEVQRSDPQDRVGMAHRAVFLSRCAFSGIATSGPIGGYAQTSKWTVDCRWNGARLAAVFAGHRKALGGRTAVTSDDVLDVLDRLPSDLPTYLDPPYYVQGDALYPAKMDAAAHAALAGRLRSRTGWLLSYDAAPQVRELYEGWADIETPAHRYSIRGVKSDWTASTELLVSMACPPPPRPHLQPLLLSERE